MGAIDKDIFEVMDDPKRRQRLAMLLAWRTLRQSIARGRAMSLPNLLRLHMRIAREVEASERQMSRCGNALAESYLSAQPLGVNARLGSTGKCVTLHDKGTRVKARREIGR